MIDHSFYMFSPTLFFDYFENNGFEIYKCFLKTRSPYYHITGQNFMNIYSKEMKSLSYQINAQKLLSLQRK